MTETQTIDTHAPAPENPSPGPEGWAKVKGGRRPHYFRDGSPLCPAKYDVPDVELARRLAEDSDCPSCAKKLAASPAPLVEQPAVGSGQPDDEVTDERAQLLAIHAIVVQGGFSTAELEAERAREAIALGLHIDWEQIKAEIVAVVAPPGPEQDAPPATREVTAEPGTRLAHLHSQYEDLKAAVTDAEERFKACTDGIKAELAGLDDQARRFFLRGPDGPPLALTHSETWRFDSKRFKAEDPETYGRYAKKGESWTLKVVTTGGEES